MQYTVYTSYIYCIYIIYIHIYMQCIYKIYIAMFPGYVSVFAFFVSSKIAASFSRPSANGCFGNYFSD